MSLRNIYKTISRNDLSQEFKKKRIFDAIYNNDLDQSIKNLHLITLKDDLVFDSKNKIIWNKSGSKGILKYNETQDWIDDLNNNRYCGFNNWRLPTIEEILSLINPENIKKNRSLLNSLFSDKLDIIWTGDKINKEKYWVLLTNRGTVHPYKLDDRAFVVPVCEEIVDFPEIRNVAKRVYRNDSGYYEAEFEDKHFFINIPEGEFIYGNDELYKVVELNCNQEKKDYLDDYWISKYPVTFDQYDQYCDIIGEKKPNDLGWPRKGRPVINTSIKDNINYCLWLRKKIGLNFRIPTENEWEKAAKGKKNNKYPWGETIPDKTLANYNYHIGQITPVDKYNAGISPYGCFDMAGNVSEQTMYKEDTKYINEINRNLTDEDELFYLSLTKGGSWNEKRIELLNSSSFKLGGESIDIGFRIVFNIDKSKS